MPAGGWASRPVSWDQATHSRCVLAGRGLPGEFRKRLPGGGQAFHLSLEGYVILVIPLLTSEEPREAAPLLDAPPGSDDLTGPEHHIVGELHGRR